ncbi:hypothetical protein HQ560_04430, partial [bacterium]|nr:hypothetical protein [bacterium]
MNHQATRSLVALLLLMAALASAAAPPAVGVLADAERLRFRGNETFSTEAIVEALGADVAVLQAAHPFAPLESYTDVLRAKLMLGYLRNGFPLAKVAVAVDDAAKAVNITIAEGPRMANGAIQVVGAQAVSEADLCKRLTTPRPTTGGEADPPAWKEGEPARFDRVSMKRMATQVRLAYAHFGRFFPDVAVKVVPQRDGRTAKLVIVVRHEGPKAVVGSIEVTGAKINRPQDVVERLGLRVGMPLDGAAVAAMERKLWHSGRFLASEIAPEEPDELSGAVCLRIRLREYDKAPPLKQALSATDQAMLRMRDRLEGFAKGSADAVFTTLQGTAETELVLSWRHGILARTRDTKAGTDEILLFGPGRLGRYELSGAE